MAKDALMAAEPMLTESLALRKTQFGRSHPSTGGTLVSLAALRNAQKRCHEGVSRSREAFAKTRQSLAWNHVLVATAAFGLARSLEACGEAGEAQPLAMEALRIRTDLMPAGAWQIREAKRDPK